jgi:hypothetical protein
MSRRDQGYRGAHRPGPGRLRPACPCAGSGGQHRATPGTARRQRAGLLIEETQVLDLTEITPEDAQ